MKTVTWPQGMYQDQLIRGGRAIHDTGWRSNIVVDRCRQLLAAFMRGDSAAIGVQSIDVGRGNPMWDTTPELPSAGAVQLVDTAPVTIPVATTDMSYLDATGNPVPGPPHRLQIVVTLAPAMPPVPMGETSYPLREFALFGVFGGERYMIDCVHHPVVHKAAGDTLVRTIRLVF